MKPLFFLLIVALVVICHVVAAADTNPASQPSSPPTAVPATQPSGSSTTSFAIPGNKSFKKQLLNLSKLFQKPWLRDLFDPLTLLLISPQSSGKSMFLSILIGFPIAPSGVGATTMFPILYVLRDSDLMGSEYCRANGKDIKIEEIFNFVKDLNDKQGGVPSNQQIEIEISRPGLVNLNILDLPGFPGKDLDRPLYDKVKPMLQNYAQKENSLIITIGDGANPDHVSHEVTIVSMCQDLTVSSMLVDKCGTQLQLSQ